MSSFLTLFPTVLKKHFMQINKNFIKLYILYLLGILGSVLWDFFFFVILHFTIFDNFSDSAT